MHIKLLPFLKTGGHQLAPGKMAITKKKERGTTMLGEDVEGKELVNALGESQSAVTVQSKHGRFYHGCSGVPAYGQGNGGHVPLCMHRSYQEPRYGHSLLSQQLMNERESKCEACV